MTLQWPAFHLARNLAGIRNLADNKDYLPGHKEVEALKYSQVAAAASVSRQTAKACIFGTTSLVSHCLKKGENIAFVLKDIGVLLIEGTRVHVKFYYDFLERISGKENLEKVVFKVSCRFLHGLGSPTSPELPAH
ncbi:coiled-coil domain-containing protein 81-like, partial [Phasianus colchicus]|uniref:coiled-coil domain-containing protein 81-like n=1 Tax=Phasianus colchicus TaxID=9054 RepID=UPI00129EC5F1